MDQSIHDFGVVGDGASDDTRAIQRAIHACHESGGGRVALPPGTYLTGTVFLKSNVELHLRMGARILGTDDLDAYAPVAAQNGDLAEGSIYGLLCAKGEENVAITGLGAIDGGGTDAPSWQEAKTMRVRPGVVFLCDCSDVRIRDVSLLNSRMWTLHLLRCRDVSIRGAALRANPAMPNSDGIDPNGCRNVTISDCLVETGDDAICLKSTDGDLCENVTVGNCILRTGCAAVKLGTESVGTIRNVTVANCVVRDSNVGLAAYMKDGGTFENIAFSNVMMDVDGPFPLLVDVTPRFHDAPRLGVIRNVSFDNVTVTGPGRCLIEGQAASPIESVRMRNITWNVTGRCDPEGEAKPNGSVRVRLDADAENYTAHPHQFIAAHVDGLTFRDIRVRYVDAEPDRGAFYLDTVADVSADNVYAPLPEGIEPTVLVNCDVEEQGA